MQGKISLSLEFNLSSPKKFFVNIFEDIFTSLYSVGFDERKEKDDSNKGTETQTNSNSTEPTPA